MPTAAGFDQTLAGLARTHADGIGVLAGARPFTYADLAAAADERAAEFDDWHGSWLGVVAGRLDGLIPTLAALDRIGIPILLLSPFLDEAERLAVAEDAGLAGVVVDGAVEARLPGAGSAAPGAVTLLTSGTTGKPKLAPHSWASLMRPTRSHERFGGRWYSAYSNSLYAGLQVFLQCFVSGGTMVTPEHPLEPAELSRYLATARVEFLCGTPSFLRQLLFRGDRAALAEAPVAQVSMGGEIATQDLLDRLRDWFPQARISHIYATTELGRCLAVSDGREGFPVEYLEGHGDEGVALRITDGELEARSVNGTDPDAGWIATGDLVTVAGDRVLFQGRRTDMINVGGHKVSPQYVEGVIRSLPGVADTRVYGISSAMTGQLVAADVVLEPDAAGDPGHQARLREELAGRLQRYERPRSIDFVDHIETSHAGKVLRREVVK